MIIDSSIRERLVAALHSEREAIMEDLRRIIAIPSVAHFAEGEHPFGDESARALDYILSRAKEMGLDTLNVGYYAGHAQYGTQEEYAGVLTHVDVVPAGEGWETDPFTLTLKDDGRLYGRGIADDKGAAVISLYCLKVLRDCGVTGKRSIRCIFGSGEEIGMTDMENYFAAQPRPEVAFTPDSDYPVCNREKGIMHFSLSIPFEEEAIATLQAGTAVNCVAEKTALVLRGTADAAAIEAVKASLESKGCQCSIAQTEDGSTAISAKGRSAHAMQPHKGLNSAALLLAGLADSGAVPMSDSLCALIDLACRDTDGSALGIARSDEPSGALTLNLGCVNVRGGKLCFDLDCRYCVTAKAEELISIINEKCAAAGVEFTLGEYLEPIYMPDDSPLVTLLSQCYTDITGLPGGTYATGGGTYARSLNGRGLAFGMAFPDSAPTHLHEANESFDCEELFRHAEICLLAMYSMML